MHSERNCGEAALANMRHHLVILQHLDIRQVSVKVHYFLAIIHLVVSSQD